MSPLTANPGTSYRRGSVTYYTLNRKGTNTTLVVEVAGLHPTPQTLITAAPEGSVRMWVCREVVGVAPLHPTPQTPPQYTAKGRTV